MQLLTEISMSCVLHPAWAMTSLRPDSAAFQHIIQQQMLDLAASKIPGGERTIYC